MTPFKLKAIDHVVIRATNARALVSFYVEAIGCKLAWDRPELGLTHLEAGDAMLDIVSIDGLLGKNGVALAAGQGRNVDHLCLRIAPFDFEAMRRHFEAFGVTIEPAQMRYGAKGRGLSIYLSDPEGNGIELKEDN